MQVKLNLNNPPTNDKINVDLRWCIDVIKPKPGFMARLFRKHNRVHRKLNIGISNIEVSPEIICNKDNLLSILYGDKIIPQCELPAKVTLSEMSTPFQLFFHQSEIKDCSRQQDENPRICPIKFSIDLSDNSGRVFESKQEVIDVIFEPLNVRPKYSIDLADEKIQYSSTLRNECIGTFATWIEEDFMFVPDQLAEVSVSLSKGMIELPGLITFEGGETSSNFVVKGGRHNVQAKKIYVDFTSISNPVNNDEEYVITVRIVRSASYSPGIKETILKQKHFKLVKDLQGTELKVYIQNPESEPVLFDMNAHTTVSMGFVPRSRLMGQVFAIIKNIATDDSNKRAGLYIKNMTLTESVVGNVQVIGENDTLLTGLINIDGADVDDMDSSRGLFIPNGHDKKTAISISFDPSKIVDLYNSNNYDFQIKSLITFDYWEDSDGIGILDEEHKKEGKIHVCWNLHMEPNPEWLCIDYGSSAIVCRYDDEIINLKNQKNRIFRTVNEGQFKLDTIESNTSFLSSDIVLHTVRNTNRTTLCSQLHANDENPPYLNLSVCLSPTSSLVKNDVRTQLPCLKILVGNEFLPSKPDFMTFRYSRIDENGLLGSIEAKDAMLRNEESCVLRISSIFNEAYAALFRYFILPSSKDKSINKLVLTYPNTYTPAHLKVLKKIVKDTFPKVRDGYLRFVSESDAVAAYYLQNWDMFNSSSRISDDETVLVFDMGAGTLDITLLKKQSRNGKIEVDILGKIGTGKAGNYLDYLLCEIIAAKVPGAVMLPKTVSTASVPDVNTLNERLEIKQAVKESVKPNLKPNQKLRCGTKEFNSSIILEDERFTDFLYQITEGILLQLFNRLNDKDITIDTVLMSGRSCRLEQLQSALRNALDNVGSPEARIVKFDSYGDKEKTVVVEGAMVSAGLFSSAESPVIIRSRRLYASYGLLYKILGGTYKYVELLSNSSLPYIKDTTVLEDYEGPSVEVSGTATAGNIKLIQTYLSPADTQLAYNNGDMEFISEMEEYDMADFGNKDSLNAKLRLDYKNNISLYVNGRRSIGTSPKGVDLTSEITKKSVWPVTI